jgi:hypothetical protein
LVEQSIRNRQVPGSSPGLGSIASFCFTSISPSPARRRQSARWISAVPASERRSYYWPRLVRRNKKLGSKNDYA